MAHPEAATAVPAEVTELLVTGMTCANCARHVTDAIQQVPGVRHASVLLDAGRASVRWAAGAQADVAAILTAVKDAGYEAKPVTAGGFEHVKQHQAGWQLNLWIGVFVTGLLMLGEWFFGVGIERWFQWLSFALGGAVQVFAGAQFYRGAWRQLKVGSSNMDTLVALGSTTAFGYSTWALLSGFGGHVYFMEAAAIITLISIGHWLEARVSARASSALASLLQLAPQTARRLGSSRSGQSQEAQTLESGDAQSLLSPAAAMEKDVPVSELKIGDLVLLRPGDGVPTDGLVEEGHSAVDEAMLTGESVPVDKSPEADLYAGTVNLNGRLVMRVTATGEATALAHIIAAVQRAQTSRADVQRLADRVSNVFVPAVVFIALAAGLWWGLVPESAKAAHAWLGEWLWRVHVPTGAAAAFIITAAVLIIACPCAMGLATPAAIMASANAAARRGILIRDGVALEKAGRVTAVVFDKTGTLTAGKPEVANIKQPEPDEETLHRIPELGEKSRDTVERASTVVVAASLARHSTHPISQAIAKASTEEIKLTDWVEVRGAGVEATLPTNENLSPALLSLPAGKKERSARLGSLHWLRELGVELSAGEGFVEEWSAQGATIVGLALNKSLIALFAVRDALKPGAAKVVEQLYLRGLKIYLLTGDNALTAASIANQAGIPSKSVFAEVRPERKAEFIKRLQQQGERVAFVGDGINDAPALEQADLGIAVGRASDVAREAADIILLRSEIEAVPEALGLAGATLRTIKQNLFWAFFYNAIGVPLAALGFMSPILCAVAMGCSDLIVIGNALRLRRWKLEHRP